MILNYKPCKNNKKTEINSTIVVNYDNRDEKEKMTQRRKEPCEITETIIITILRDNSSLLDRKNHKHNPENPLPLNQ